MKINNPFKRLSLNIREMNITKTETFLLLFATLLFLDHVVHDEVTQDIRLDF